MSDEISELVDWQLENEFSQSRGDSCRFCREEWHYLKITKKIREMRAAGVVDPDYCYADDDSAMWCPGSTFDGEFTRDVEDFPDYTNCTGWPPAVASIYAETFHFMNSLRLPADPEVESLQHRLAWVGIGGFYEAEDNG